MKKANAKPRSGTCAISGSGRGDDLRYDQEQYRRTPSSPSMQLIFHPLGMGQ